MAQRHLHAVDTQTGEILEDHPEVVGLQKTIRSQAATIGNLHRQLTEALNEVDRNHDAFPAFKRCHDYWRERCNHPRTKYDLDDFKLFLPLYEKHGEEMCRTAIEGAAYDPYTSVRRNGSTKRHDGWELIFRNGAKFREFCNRAPHHLPDPEHIKTLANALAFLDKDKPIGECVEEARRRLGG